MHSSTSNFKRSIPNVPWLRVLAIAASVAVALICSAEITLRSLGYTPTVVDDPDLWSLERSRILSDRKTIALVGNSQLMWGVNPAIVTEMTGFRAIMLAVEGSSPIPVLADLAADQSFSGVVICASGPVHFLPLQFNEQQSLVDYYYSTFSYNKSINRIISNWLQSHLTYLDPYSSPKRLIQEYIIWGSLPGPRPVLTLSDRSRRYDYTKVNVNERKKALLEGSEKFLREARLLYSRSEWIKYADEIVRYSKDIYKRGGVVVFFRLPISGEAQLIEEKYFPRSEYWDYWVNSNKLNAYHYEDIDEFKKFIYPDHYHIDAKDVDDFTRTLIRYSRLVNINADNLIN